MGISYSAVIGIGKEFSDSYEAESFLEQHNILTDDDREVIEEDGLSEWLYSNKKVEGRLLNYYSGDYYFVGYELSCSDPESFRKSFEEGMENWDKYFPDVAPDVIKTVQVS